MQTKSITLPLNAHFESSSTINFEIRSAENELVRFQENAFCVQFYVLHKNPRVIGGAGDHTKLEYYTVKPSEEDPAVYIHSLVAGSTFLENIKLTIDGKEFPSLPGGSEHHLYTALNRLAATLLLLLLLLLMLLTSSLMPLLLLLLLLLQTLLHAVDKEGKVWLRLGLDLYVL